MQNKVDKLIELFNNFHSERQKNYAIKLLADIVDVINNQSKNIGELTARKFGIIPGQIDTELDKYIITLLLHGYSQDDFKLISHETLKFLLDNKNQLTRPPTPGNTIKIQNMIMQFEFENNREPNDINELKEYIANAVKD